MDNFLFTGGGDGRVKKLDLISGKWNLTHEAQLEGKVTSLSLSTDRKELVAGTSKDRIYRLLTTDLSYLVHTEAQNGSVNDISFGSTRSDQFCCIDSAGACKIWDSSEYKCVFNIKHGPIKMTAVAVSPSGKWMAVGSETSEISVFNI